MCADKEEVHSEGEEDEQVDPTKAADPASAAKKKKKNKKKKKTATASAETSEASTASAQVPSTEPVAKPAEPAAVTKASDALSLIESRLKELAQLPKKKNDDAETRAHAFWDSQPVPKFGSKIESEGPIEADKAEIRQTPLNLPSAFMWSDVDVHNPKELDELYELLANHYVSDSESKFRFDYSREFLQWALTPPGWLKQWHVGVRYTKNNKLFAFISAVPVHLRVGDKTNMFVEINFLCAHTKIRENRVAPVLISEVTRRVNLQGIFQATYTSGTLIPRPVTTCRYNHRLINSKKLIEVGFSVLYKTTMAQLINKNTLPSATTIPGLRRFESRDVDQVHHLLNNYLTKFKMAPIFSKEEILHYFTYRDRILYSFVVEEGDKITALTSFYCLPSSISNHPEHKVLNAAYSYYNVVTDAFQEDLQTLMFNALIIAKKEQFDVFNALDLMDNASFLSALNFGKGDGNLHYYLYNYALQDFKTELNALVLF